MSSRGAFLRVLGVSRRHAIWLALASVCMVVVAVATVFSYNLVRPLLDELLRPAGEVAAPGGSPADGASLIDILDQVAEQGRQRLMDLVGSSPRALLLLALLAVVTKNVFAFVARLSAARFGLATMCDLRIMLFDALLGQSPAYFHHQATGNLMARVVHDIELIREALAERMGDVLQDGLTLVLLVSYALALNTRLALMTLVLSPLMVAPVLVLSRRLRRRSKQAQDRMGELASLLGETVRGSRVVQAYGMESRLAARFRSLAKRHFRARVQARAVQAANAPVMEIVGAIAALALIAWAARQIGVGGMTLGDFTAFLVAAWGAYNPVKRLNKFNLAVQQAAVAADRVYEVLDAPVAIRDLPGARPRDLSGGGIELREVCFSYGGGSRVLHDLNLEIPCGRTVALVGPSGAGKSTIAQLIPRFHDACEGEVLVAGFDVRKIELSSLRSQIGVVTQETILFDESIAANIAAGWPAPSRQRVEEAARLANADGFIQSMPEGLDTVIGEAGVRLSGGQRQRLAIARALYRDPPILILDEATSSLDPEAERLVALALSNLVKRRTSLLIAHRLSTIRLADTIAVLEGGRIVELGTHDKLMSSAEGSYRRLIDAADGPLIV